MRSTRTKTMSPEDEILLYRNQERLAMMMERAPKFLCDLCGKAVGTDMHEAVAPRSKTMKNDEARRASFDRRLCAWVCRPCHEKAQNSETATIILLMNIERYGRQNTAEAYYTLKEHMEFQQLIDFPD